MYSKCKYHIVSLCCLLFHVGLCHGQDAQETTFRAAVDKIAPSLLRMETIGGKEKVDDTLIGEGVGTAVIVDSSGYLLTSAMLLAHEPTSILAITPSGKREAAKVIARDFSCNIALLKIETSETLIAAEQVTKPNYKIGQWCIAVGKTLNAKLPNYSVGILSAADRLEGKALQTDAKVSAMNYGGPLIDINGNMLGILTPLAIPGDANHIAGAAWYDSGIGFAVPCTRWQKHWQNWKMAKDLHAGILGLTLQPGHLYADPAIIATCQPNSPAKKAGLQPGDKIVKIGDSTIERQIQLRMALGKYCAGETVSVTLLRKDKTITSELELIDKLEPYEYLWLGFLPSSIPPKSGIAVRYVFPKSPAAVAGLQSNDMILKANDKELTSPEQLITLLANVEQTSDLKLSVQRGDTTLSIDVKLAPLNAALPSALPDAENSVTEKKASATHEFKLPEEKHICLAYIPEHTAAQKMGLLLWYGPTGKYTSENLAADWGELAKKHNFMVLAPRPETAGRWQRAEVPIIRKFLEQTIANYAIDTQRIAVHGEQTGGASMAWITHLTQADRIRGIAVSDMPPPKSAELNNDPMQRNFVWLGYSAKTKQNSEFSEALKRLQINKIPVVEHLAEENESLATQRQSIALWLESLNRL